MLPAVGRAADRLARRLHPARNSLRRSFLAGARSRAMGRQRSGHAGVSRFPAGAGAEGSESAARRTRRARWRRPHHRGRKKSARAGAAAAAGAHDRRFASAGRRRRGRRHRRHPDRARAWRRRRRSRRTARSVPPRPLAARQQRAQSRAALGAAGGDDGRPADEDDLAFHRRHAGAGLSRTASRATAAMAALCWPTAAALPSSRPRRWRARPISRSPN